MCTRKKQQLSENRRNKIHESSKSKKYNHWRRNTEDPVFQIVGVTKEEILEAGKNICTIGADVIEWRVDWYENVFDFRPGRRDCKRIEKCNRRDCTVIYLPYRKMKGGKKQLKTECLRGVK